MLIVQVDKLLVLDGKKVKWPIKSVELLPQIFDPPPLAFGARFANRIEDSDNQSAAEEAHDQLRDRLPSCWLGITGYRHGHRLYP
jgi:hypothetical protein